MITDKEIARQMIERDIMNIYRQLPQLSGNLGINISPILGLFQDKIFSYLDVAIDSFLDALFGKDGEGDIDEASDIAKMFATDKIEEYRKRVREHKAKIEEENS